MNTTIESLWPDTASSKSRHLQGRILLVDDDLAIRWTLTRLLTGEGYSVLPAANGAQAIEFYSRVNFDLVLLDLKMPGMDGWNTFEHLTSKNPLVPFIIITARPNQNFIAQAAGIGALMEKPLDLEQLCLTIRELLDEPDDIRLARVAGRLSEFHYVPPAARPTGARASWKRN